MPILNDSCFHFHLVLYHGIPIMEVEKKWEEPYFQACRKQQSCRSPYTPRNRWISLAWSRDFSSYWGNQNSSSYWGNQNSFCHIWDQNFGPGWEENWSGKVSVNSCMELETTKFCKIIMHVGTVITLCRSLLLPCASSHVSLPNRSHSWRLTVFSVFVYVIVSESGKERFPINCT